jgi:hypothetical protein
LNLWGKHDPAVGDFVLWRSDDGGATWYDFTYSSELVWTIWDDTSVEFRYSNILSPIMFCLEVPGVGESNVVTIYEKDGVSCGDCGGDRTGTDRHGGGEGGFGYPGDNYGDGNNNGSGKDNGNRNNPGNGSTGGIGYPSEDDNGDEYDPQSDNAVYESDNDDHFDDNGNNEGINEGKEVDEYTSVFVSDNTGENLSIIAIADKTEDEQYENLSATTSISLANDEERHREYPKGANARDETDNLAIGFSIGQPLDGNADNNTQMGDESLQDNTNSGVNSDVNNIAPAVPVAVLLTPPAAPFIPTGDFTAALTVSIAAATLCFGGLILLRFRRFLKVKK